MIILTGGSGKAGRACISELLAHHYEVASVDLVRGPDSPYRSAGLSSLISARRWRRFPRLMIVSAM
jgi:nucleoside-diphosphate-sugar epimerase